MVTDFQFFDIYCDVHPFKETSIWVGSADAENPSSESYINANRIRSVYHEPLDDNLVIAAQGPMTNTTGAFWGMVSQENVQRIVTLVEHIGEGGDCSHYFPGKTIGDEETYGTVTVKLVA